MYKRFWIVSVNRRIVGVFTSKEYNNADQCKQVYNNSSIEPMEVLERPLIGNLIDS